MLIRGLWKPFPDIMCGRVVIDIQVKKVSYIEVVTDFYPKRVYRCPYLTQLVNQIYGVGLREYAKILMAVSICRMPPVFVFSTHVENKESCFLMCVVHMKLILRAEANYDCTTETSDEFLFMR